MTLLAKHTQGVPRLINQAGHQALTLAESLELDQIDAEVVLEALAAIGSLRHFQQSHRAAADPSTRCSKTLAT